LKFAMQTADETNKRSACGKSGFAQIGFYHTTAVKKRKTDGAEEIVKMDMNP